MARQHGFTLLEILCVVFLLGLMASVVVGALPDGRQKAVKEYDKLRFVIGTTAERARLDGKIYGFKVLPGSWEIQVLARRPPESKPPATPELIEGYDWQTAMYGRKKMQYRLPVQVVMRIEAGGEVWTSSETSERAETPQILFLPGGEVTEFTLSLFETNKVRGGEGDVSDSALSLSRDALLTGGTSG